MATTVHLLTRTATPLPHALGLAYQLGELIVDFKRRGIALTMQPNEIRISFDEMQTYAVRWDEPLEGLSLLASEKENRVILGITRLFRRGSLLVRSDSHLRGIQDLNGVELGIPKLADNSLDPWHAAASKAVHDFLGSTNSYESYKIKVAPLIVHSAAIPEEQAVAERLTEALLLGEADIVYAEGVLDQRLRSFVGARSIYSKRYAVPILLTAPMRFVEEQPEEAKRLLGHIVAAMEWAEQHAEETYRLIGHLTGVPEKEITTVFSDHLHAQLHMELTSDLTTELQEIQSWLLDNHFLEKSLELGTYLTKDLLTEAAGVISSLNPKELSPYAITDVPQEYFTDRRSVRVLKTEEEVLEAAAQFADSIKDGASERDRERRLPFPELLELSESGLLGATVPQAYGGAGISTAALTDIIRMISKADGSIGQIPQNHYYFLKAVELVGTEEQKRLFFGEVLRGALLGNAIAERGVKKDFKHMSTRLTRSKGEAGYRLSGSKYYSTGSLYANWIPVAALNEEDKRVIVYVPRHAQGVTVIDDWSGIGQRITGSGSVILRDVEVPEQYVLPNYHIFDLPNTYLAYGQIMHAAIDTGIAQAALEDAAAFVREKTRPAYGSGVEHASDEPDMIRRFGELGIRLYASEALLEKAAAAMDKAEVLPSQDHVGQAGLLVEAAKYSMTETVIEVTNALFEVAGTASMDIKYNYDRHWRNARIHTLHDPARLKLRHVGNWVLNGVYHEQKI
ncbi:SfnB family sulfur acquisition oxidoreductase [Paenibacillus sp. YAF4_2]|uniref:SfnB family sulfur acquisition oxidoreductase n=1 Tax=Paenibacillus sp. YAF4_2 TaxID=3233085 RepID=UPI003F9C8957